MLIRTAAFPGTRPGSFVPLPPKPQGTSLVVDELQREINRFLRQHKMAQTRFGVLAMGNANFFRRLREGIEPKPSTFDKVRAFMASYARDAMGLGT